MESLIQDVAKLLRSAGLAIQSLTNTKPDDPSVTTDGSLESRKAQFRQATNQYFALLSSVDVRLRRQVYALEEASVLAPDSSSRPSDALGTGAGGTVVSSTGTPNALDISWLNSRKDTVGKDKEAELWAAARQFVEQLDQKSKMHQDSGKANDGSERMQVD